MTQFDRSTWRRSSLPAASLLLLLAALLAGPRAAAYSFGAPVCEIDQSSMSINMTASVLASPGGWSLQAPSNYTPGTPITISLAHANATRQFRGVLLWATTGGAGGLGSWIVPFQYQNAGGCQWSLTHTDAGAKAQQSYQFNPPAAGAGPLAFHAFLVEDCGGPAGSCRPNWVQLGDVLVAEVPSGDTVPNAFSFNAQSDVTPGALLTSNPVTITGIDTPSNISVSGGQYSIGCAAGYTSQAGTISNGQAVCVRHTASPSFQTTVSTTLTIGGVSGTFSTTTLAAPVFHALTVARSGAGSGTVSSTPSGIDCGSTCAASFISGTSVTLAATAGSGSSFAGWSGACAGSGTCTVAMDAAKSVGANFSLLPPATSTLSVSKAGTGAGTVVSSPSGIDCGSTCAASFISGTSVTLAAAAATGSTFAGWSGDCTGSGACTITMDAGKAVTATFSTASTPGVLGASPAALDFGGQSMSTTSPARTVTFTNGGDTPVTVTSLAASTHFAVTHDCSTVNAGSSCTAIVTFTPTVAGALAGTLSVASGGGTQSVALSGSGEKSLVTHYYRSILRRAPDTGGKAFWDGEATRVQALGVNVNEVWFAMAQSFYFSAEYLAFNRDDAGFVTDLYGTFFNRAPDTGGFNDWTTQLAAGMPREVVLASFMFSTEFAAFTQGIFGTQVTRKEADTVVDFFRGLLARLPDDGGFNFWVQQFRTAQCQGGAAVNAQVESISSQFALDAEYAARNRSNSQYVGDLYNAFLRRGGDLGGVQFWISQVTTGARTRENVRQAFVASPEFQARVAAIISQGCLP